MRTRSRSRAREGELSEGNQTFLLSRRACGRRPITNTVIAPIESNDFSATNAACDEIPEDHLATASHSPSDVV